MPENKAVQNDIPKGDPPKFVANFASEKDNPQVRPIYNMHSHGINVWYNYIALWILIICDFSNKT